MGQIERAALTYIYIQPCIKQIASGKLHSPGSSARSSVMTQSSGMGGGSEAQKGETLCVLLTDSHCCTWETNSTL